MKIVLVNADMVDLKAFFNSKTVERITAQIHLGICYLTAILEDNGIEVVDIDNHLEGLSNDEIVKKILMLDPPVTGFATTCMNVENAYQIAGKLKKKKPGMVTVFGGPQATLLLKMS